MQLIKFMWKRDNAFRSKFFNLSLPILLPVLKVRIAERSKRTTRPDCSLDPGVVICFDDSKHPSVLCLESNTTPLGMNLLLFPIPRRLALLRNNEPCAYPHSTRTHHQRSCNTSPIIDTSCCYKRNRLTSHRGFVLLAHIRTRWDKHTSRDITRMSTSLSSLCNDDISTCLTRFVHVLGVSNHIATKATSVSI